VIRRAQAADIDVLRELFREYAVWVGSAICLDAFNRELTDCQGATLRC